MDVSVKNLLVIHPVQAHQLLTLQSLCIQVMDAERQPSRDLRPEEHRLLETVLGPLAQVRRQLRQLDRSRRLAVEVVAGSHVPGVGPRHTWAARRTTLGASRPGNPQASSSGRLQEGVDAAGGGKLVGCSGEGAGGGLGSCPARRSEVTR